MAQLVSVATKFNATILRSSLRFASTARKLGTAVPQVKTFTTNQEIAVKRYKYLKSSDKVTTKLIYFLKLVQVIKAIRSRSKTHDCPCIIR
jgi:hypothetical protein